MALLYTGAEAERKRRVRLVECGSCDQYHPETFGGDCREDATRIAVPDLDRHEVISEGGR